MTSRQPDRGSGGLDPADAAVRAARRVECAARAELLVVVAARAGELERVLRAEEAATGMLVPVELRYTDEQITSLVVNELAVLLGMSRAATGRLVAEARAVTAVMPPVLAALSGGRWDPARVSALVEATAELSEAAAARVATIVLARDAARLRTLGITQDVAGVWDLVTYSTWRWHLGRAVARVQAHPDTEDDVLVSLPDPPSVRVRVHDAGDADLVFTGTIEDVRWLHTVLEDLADVTVPAGALAPDGSRLRAGERLAAALLGLCAQVTGTGDVPTVTIGSAGSGRRRELGLVMHADTFLDHGPAAGDPGEVRGHGTPIPVPAADARAMAHRAVDTGAGTCLLLADAGGRLVRMLRIGPAPAGGWTRDRLVAAGRDVLAAARPSSTAAHDPTVAIDEHVRAAHPVSVAPGTGAATHSGSRSVDLDHRIPHPRGPTDHENLQPLHRTPHRYKTRGTWRCVRNNDGTLTWTTRTRATWTHVPEPLPGHAHGEAYAPTP